MGVEGIFGDTDFVLVVTDLFFDVVLIWRAIDIDDFDCNTFDWWGWGTGPWDAPIENSQAVFSRRNRLDTKAAAKIVDDAISITTFRNTPLAVEVPRTSSNNRNKVVIVIQILIVIHKTRLTGHWFNDGNTWDTIVGDGEYVIAILSAAKSIDNNVVLDTKNGRPRGGGPKTTITVIIVTNTT
jgi:hypothetical protein